MRTIHTSNWLRACILLSLTAMSVSGCVFRTVAQPTPTPLPTATSTASPTPPPTSTPQPRRTPDSPCAISWRWTENSLLISYVDLSRADGLMRSDEVLTINGRLPIEVILEAEEEITVFDSPENRRAQALEKMLHDSELLVLLFGHQNDPPYFFNLRTGCKKPPPAD